MSAPVIRCTRCSRRLRGDASAWNGEFRAGELVAVICPSCQSVEENHEAAVNDATLTYGARLEGGRFQVRGFPKGVQR